MHTQTHTHIHLHTHTHTYTYTHTHTRTHTHAYTYTHTHTRTRTHTHTINRPGLSSRSAAGGDATVACTVPSGAGSCKYTRPPSWLHPTAQTEPAPKTEKLATTKNSKQNWHKIGVDIN